MARDFRKTQKVPIGAIDDSWGGTPIRAWMGEARARAGKRAPPISSYRTDEPAALGHFAIGAVVGPQTGTARAEPWNASDRLAWKPVPQINELEHWGGAGERRRRRPACR